MTSIHGRLGAVMLVCLVAALLISAGTAPAHERTPPAADGITEWRFTVRWVPGMRGDGRFRPQVLAMLNSSGDFVRTPRLAVPDGDACLKYTFIGPEASMQLLDVFVSGRFDRADVGQFPPDGTYWEFTLTGKVAGRDRRIRHMFWELYIDAVERKRDQFKQSVEAIEEEVRHLADEPLRVLRELDANHGD